MNVWTSPSPNLPVMKNKQESNDSKSLHSATRQLSHLGFQSFAKIRDIIYSLMNICGKPGLLLQTGTKLFFLPLNTFNTLNTDMLTIPNFCWSHRLLEIPKIPQTSLYWWMKWVALGWMGSTTLSGRKKCWRGTMSHTTNLAEQSGLLSTSLRGTEMAEEPRYDPSPTLNQEGGKTSLHLIQSGTHM